jgi:hypothetical protein
MTDPRRTWTWGLGAGLVAAALDVALILAVDPAVPRWTLLEAGAFWAVAGWVVVASTSGLGWWGHGMLVTVLLNLPWYLVEGPAAGHPEHVPPLAIMSLVFGVAFGWARRCALQGRPGSATGGGRP